MGKARSKTSRAARRQNLPSLLKCCSHLALFMSFVFRLTPCDKPQWGLPRPKPPRRSLRARSVSVPDAVRERYPGVAPHGCRDSQTPGPPSKSPCSPSEKVHPCLERSIDGNGQSNESLDY